jgi:hypothetical protein
LNPPTWQAIAKEILSTLNITLSPEQASPFYSDARITLVSAGEGFGKSHQAALKALCRSLADVRIRGLKHQLVWIVGADYEDARTEVEFLHGPEYTWLKDLGIFDEEHSSIPTGTDKKVILRASVKDPDGREIASIIFETVSAYDVKKVGRKEPDAILGVEASRWETVEVYRRIKGRIARKFPFAWVHMTGSPEESESWFAETYELGQGPNEEGLVSYNGPSWGNLTRYPGGWDDPAIVMLRNTEPEARFWARYGGKPQQPSDSVFPEFKTMLHVNEEVDLDYNYPTYIAIDPGTNVNAILFVQFVGREIHVVDEIYTHGWSIEAVIQEAMLRPAWKLLSRTGHVMDIAGRQVHGGIGSPHQIWLDLTGIDFEGRAYHVDAEIDKLRSVLNINLATFRPYLQIHPRCRGLIAEKGGGPPPLPGISGRWRAKNGIAERNKNNHSCQALAYLLLHHFGANRPNEQYEEDDGHSYLRPVTEQVSHIVRDSTEKAQSYLRRHLAEVRPS